MNTSQSLTHWQNLIERYFEAQTTEGEEAQLRAFVTSSRAEAEEFRPLQSQLNEVRALMGFAAMARRMQHTASVSPRVAIKTTQPAHRPTLWRSVAAALLITALIGSGTLIYDYRHPDCVAYVGGQRITDPAQVQQEMERTLQDALAPTADAPTMESQLNDMFSTLKENQHLN